MMWLDSNYIDPLEKTFGELVKEGYTLPQGYLFYDESQRQQFEKKFYRHFKYYRIGYSSTEMFSDMFEDVLEVNYPKYKHYWDTLEKAKTLKWWNNKDFVTRFERDLTKEGSTDTVSTLDKLDKLISTLQKSGNVTDDYTRALKEKTVANDTTNTTNTLAKSGTNTSSVAKDTTVTDDFTRALTSSEIQTNSDTKNSTSTNRNNSKNDSISNTANEEVSNSTNKNLDTPQGTINNLIDNVNAYMTTATVDSSKDISTSNTTSSSTNTGESTDTSQLQGTENKDKQNTESGTTKNVSATKGTDVKTDTLGERHETTVSDVKNNDTTLDKTGTAQDTKTYNTTDTTTKIVTDKDTTNTAVKSNGKDLENYTKTEEGNIGVTSAGQLVYDWLRYGYINIDKMIIRDCERLFLQVY